MSRMSQKVKSQKRATRERESPPLSPGWARDCGPSSRLEISREGDPTSLRPHAKGQSKLLWPTSRLNAADEWISDGNRGVPPSTDRAEQLVEPESAAAGCSRRLPPQNGPWSSHHRLPPLPPKPHQALERELRGRVRRPVGPLRQSGQDRPAGTRGGKGGRGELAGGHRFCVPGALTASWAVRAEGRRADVLRF